MRNVLILGLDRLSVLNYFFGWQKQQEWMKI